MTLWRAFYPGAGAGGHTPLPLHPSGQRRDSKAGWPFVTAPCRLDWTGGEHQLLVAVLDNQSVSGSLRTESRQLAVALLSLGTVTVLLHQLAVSNAATVSTSYLVVVLLVAAASQLRVAVATSVVAMLSLNYFFLPPVGTFTIAEPHNWVALFAFLAVSLVASHLASVARARTEDAVTRRDELARLFDLTRDVLIMTDSREALAVLARAVGRRFDLPLVAIALPRGGEWDVQTAGTRPPALDARDLTDAFAAAQAPLEFDATARTYAGHRTVSLDGQPAHVVPLRVGTRPVGLLVSGGRRVEAGTLDALAGVVAIAIERMRFLEERRVAELTRQREQLQTTLLASLGHDLRTPLTAIGVAASNLDESALTTAERSGQTALIRAEVSRLTRLFDNLLAMAHLDAGAVAPDRRWSHPSEIIAAARDHVTQVLRGHVLDTSIDHDTPVQLDPRLVAAALAHVLENAAQYAPPDSTIHLTAQVTDANLTLRVRDHGGGIPPADLAQLFERFYRGSAASASRPSGTGLGLWIARGLLAVAGGRIWAENHPDGGAEFTMELPVQVRVAADASVSHA